MLLAQTLAQIFEDLALMLEFHANPGDGFKIRAFKNAAEAILSVSEPIEKLYTEKRLTSIPGIGFGISKKIEEYIEHGVIAEYELLKKTVPTDFFKMLQIPTLGPKKVRALVDHLGVQTIADLEKVLAEDKVASLPRFGKKSAENIQKGLNLKVERTGRRLRGDVTLFVEQIVAMLLQNINLTRVVPAGSYRRGEETVGDIDILVTGPKMKDQKVVDSIMKYFVELPFVERILGQGDTKSSIITNDGLQVDLRVVEEHEFGSALQYFTGSKAHNVHLRNIAKTHDLKLNEYGVFRGEKLVASQTEEDCYKSLGLSYIPPEMRTDTGEIEAGLKHKIPTLLELKDIRGDLHVHTNYSDGVHTLEAMVQAAQNLGYEYVAITDHSPSLRVANGLTKDRLKIKFEHIRRIEDSYKIKILYGTEVDILPDGSIDYPDDILKQFDVVVASVHSRFTVDNTKRIMKAMENPYVHILGHPSGRNVGTRASYPIDYEKIFQHAVKTGTVLEINAQPKRLDLIDIYMRPAIEAGCMFSVDTDSHSTDGLLLMQFGVTWARRGWVQKKYVVNTLPLKKLMEIFRAKLH